MGFCNLLAHIGIDLVHSAFHFLWLQEQIQQLQQLLQEANGAAEILEAAEAAYSALIEARIIENPHTKLSMQVSQLPVSFPQKVAVTVIEG